MTELRLRGLIGRKNHPRHYWIHPPKFPNPNERARLGTHWRRSSVKDIAAVIRLRGRLNCTPRIISVYTCLWTYAKLRAFNTETDVRIGPSGQGQGLSFAVSTDFATVNHVSHTHVDSYRCRSSIRKEQKKIEDIQWTMLNYLDKLVWTRAIVSKIIF